MNQAITVKYHAGGPARGACLIASCERGRMRVDYPHHLNRDARYRYAAEQLVARFLAEDEKRGEPRGKNPWAQPFVGGYVKDSLAVFVRVDVDAVTEFIHRAARAEPGSLSARDLETITDFLKVL